MLNEMGRTIYILLLVIFGLILDYGNQANASGELHCVSIQPDNAKSATLLDALPGTYAESMIEKTGSCDGCASNGLCCSQLAVQEQVRTQGPDLSLERLEVANPYRLPPSRTLKPEPPPPNA